MHKHLESAAMSFCIKISNDHVEDHQIAKSVDDISAHADTIATASRRLLARYTASCQQLASFSMPVQGNNDVRDDFDSLRSLLLAQREKTSHRLEILLKDRRDSFLANSREIDLWQQYVLSPSTHTLKDAADWILLAKQCQKGAQLLIKDVTRSSHDKK